MLLTLLAPLVTEAASVGKRELALAQKALPVLRDECFACHSPEKKKGGLVLTSREAVLKGGSEGPAAVSGKPDASRLLSLLAKESDPHMPPKKQLTDAQIRSLRDWVKAGLPWSDEALSDEGPLPPAVSLAPLPAIYRPAGAVALSPDGRWLAAAQGGELSLHDLAATNAAPSETVPAHLDVIQSLAWSPDGKALATAGFRRVSLWTTNPLQRRQDWTNGLVGRVTALAFSSDGTRLAVGDGEAGRSGFVRVFATDSGQRLASWRAHADSVLGLQFSADGQRLVTAGGDRLVRVWDTATRREIAILEGHTAQVLAAAFNTNATQVVSGGADKQLKVWDIATREKLVTLGNGAAPVTAVAWPPGANAIFAATDAGQLFRYTNLKPHTGEQSSATADERQLATAPDLILGLSVSGDGQRLAIARHDGWVQVFDGEGKELKKLGPLSDAKSETKLSSARPALSPGERGKGSQRQSPKDRPEGAPTDSPILRAKRSGITFASLSAEPKIVALTPDSPRTQLVLTALGSDGFEYDVTELARFSSSRRAPFTVAAAGELTALGAGVGTVTAALGKLTVEVPVSVSAGGTNGAATAPLSFTRDVLPVLAQAGCAAGACHAKADGQNGFKLSVFSYDPKHDHAEIVKDARGRRVFPAAPDESLLLRKPLGLVPHEGGKRFEAGSETHRLLHRWIAEGMAYAQTNEPALERIAVFPPERRFHRGSVQRLRLEAVYADGSVRDVTRLAAFESNDKEIAQVDEEARVTVGKVTGQGVIVARFMGLVAAARIVVPAERTLPAEPFARLPRNNFVDELAYAQFQRLGLLPSALCTDTEFLRRASLDILGVLPTAEEAREVATAPAPLDRAALVERLLARPEFADHWANKWADLLRPNPDRVGVKSVLTLDEWLRASFRADQPYDQFVREILLTEGSNHRDGPAVVYRDRREPPELTTMFSQLFLGTRLECAKCHHHPNEKWSQDDFYQFAAFFGPVKQKGAGLSPPISAGRETFYFAPGGSVRHPVSGELMVPKAPDGPVLRPADGADPRAALAEWLTATNNPFFARAAVNRVWATFFGRGLVEPVDDFRVSNPCVNDPLLDALAADFAAHGYRLKHLIRTLVGSRLYQLSSTPNETNLADTKNFSRAYRRRLPAEVLLDAVNDATGVPDTFAATAPGTRAMQTWSYKIDSPFMDAFSRPNPSSDPPCERDRQMSVVQSLHLMNAQNLQAKLGHAGGRVQRLAEGSLPPAELVTELYLATLGRLPQAGELQVAVAAFTAPDATRKTAAEDVFWALLNSPEFVFNH